MRGRHHPGLIGRSEVDVVPRESIGITGINPIGDSAGQENTSVMLGITAAGRPAGRVGISPKPPRDDRLGIEQRGAEKLDIDGIAGSCTWRSKKLRFGSIDRYR